MHNLSDEELDRLGKEAAERYSAPQVQSTWEKLSRRLDEEMPQARKDRRIIFWLVLLLLLMGAGTFFYFTNSNGSDNKLGASRENPAGTIATIEKEASPSDPVSQTDNVKPNVESAKKEANSNLQGKSNEATTRDAVSLHQTDSKNTNEAFGVKSRNNKNNKTQKNKAQKNGSGQVNANNNTLSAGEETPKDILDDNQDTKVAGNNSMSSAGDQGADKPDAKTDAKKNLPVAAIKEETANPAEAKKNKKQGYLTPYRKWEIGLVYGPDFSNVKFTHKDEMGFNVGITIGYNFNRRLSVNTGFLYTKKNYTTSGENYKFPPGYWAANPNVKMNTVEASCYMFDIPINVRYNVVAAKKYSIFASAGLSSYLMDKEKFNYYYTYNSYPYGRSWTNNKSDNYFLSIANLSIGYEHQLSPSISLQAEPFFKFSLDDVGFGSVSLNSMGIFASVKYKPSFGKKRATGNK